MKKNLATLVFTTLVILGCLALAMPISRAFSELEHRDTQDKVEIGMKMADIKWLYRFGFISDSEMESLAEAAKEGISLNEYRELVDNMLSGKEDAFLEEFGELVLYPDIEIKFTT